MTNKREQSKKEIRAFFREHRRMPSYREIMDLLGYKSKNAVFKLVNALVGDGFLSRDEDGQVVPANMFGAVRVLGTVAAGFPSPAEEELADTMSLDDYLIHNKEATFMLRVQGDSMIEAGIHEGDMVIVERAATARDGDIIIAEVDDGWTMKYYRYRGGRVYLEAANQKYHPIMPREELRIAAVVKAVIRKY